MGRGPRGSRTKNTTVTNQKLKVEEKGPPNNRIWQCLTKSDIVWQTLKIWHNPTNAKSLTKSDKSDNVWQNLTNLTMSDKIRLTQKIWQFLSKSEIIRGIWHWQKLPPSTLHFHHHHYTSSITITLPPSPLYKVIQNLDPGAQTPKTANFYDDKANIS